jgi:hypothetical protein
VLLCAALLVGDLLVAAPDAGHGNAGFEEEFELPDVMVFHAVEVDAAMCSVDGLEAQITVRGVAEVIRSAALE